MTSTSLRAHRRQLEIDVPGQVDCKDASQTRLVAHFDQSAICLDAAPTDIET
jgi:hypothetical protein